ncbi:MAG: pyridoxal-dependent decarboxylase [Gemmatimonadetes bacterium]|nr:pyridoxal-dependent decarboxylase [Gemmatimonadota bacterium]
MNNSPHDALLSWFLGPQAENADLFERLITEALRDHVFWRRNYHPEDGITIRELDKRSAGYEETVATLTQELMGLLAELKRDVPFFSGRYLGHMAYQQTIASQVGYFAAMLYNPNNVSPEAAPVTTRLEQEVVQQMAEMVGYRRDGAWGHLTSGGTVANFEALWIARNVLYLPVAVVGAAQSLGLDLEVRLPDGSNADIGQLDLSQLLNIANRDVLDLWERSWQVTPREDMARALAQHSLATAGYQDYGRRLAAEYGDALPDSVVLVAATAHYSWEKIVRALGIGSNQLIYVPVDGNYRMDPEALWDRLKALHARRTPVLACISVCGTTEESAVDRLDLVLEVRARAGQELGMTFHLHSDACYGGYAASVIRGPDGVRRTGQEIRDALGEDWPSDEWVRSMVALADADSISIDPHKLGYIPYPAGAILLKDRRARELVAVDPPYLASAGQAEGTEQEYLGRFIFEGSKPGAAAAAVWLSHKVLPLDESGYGYLIGRTVVGARQLYRALARHDFAPFRIILLPEPDINIVCYLLHHPLLENLEAVNALNEGVYQVMSVSAKPDPEYIITRTRFQTPMYDGAVDPLLEQLGVATPAEWTAAGKEGLVVLRSTVMDPFLADPPPSPDHISGFLDALADAGAVSLARLISSPPV